MNIRELKFPIGEFVTNKNPDKVIIDKWIEDIETFPSNLEKITNGISKKQLNWKYRPEGWTVKQVIHHCTDSHINSVIRFKLALTENTPTIRPYYEDRWANLIDCLDDDISNSLLLLKALHKKWIIILRSLADQDLKLEFIHPEHGTKFNLAEAIGMYAWHCNHHYAHVVNGISSEGKYN